MASQIALVKKVLDKKRYELLEGEIDELMKEIAELADVLGLEIEELPKHLPFYTLPAEEIVDWEISISFFVCICMRLECVKVWDSQNRW